MNNCLELFYDQFCIDFYESDGVVGDLPSLSSRRAIDASTISINEAKRFFSVGRFSSPDATHFRANDTADEVTTSVEESVDEDSFSEVSIHFEFQKPTLNMLNMCDQLGYKSVVALVRFLGPDGKTSGTRLIRPSNEYAQKVEITESAGITSVDFTAYTVNGIQPLL